MTATLGKIYTLAEASEKLRISSRAVCKIARANGLCTIINREYLFSENDIVDIWNAKRCLLNSPAATAQTHGTSVVQFAGKAYSNLVEHAKKKKQRRSV